MTAGGPQIPAIMPRGGSLSNTASVLTRWETLPHRLNSEATKWVYIGPDGSWWDLAGPDAGRQGVQLSEEMQGAVHIPFEHLLTETAYQMGATYERTNIVKRTINFGAMIGSQTRKLNAHQFDMVSSRWWNAWPIGQPGWLGAHTWLHGWRWIPVIEGGPSRTSQKKDPKYAKNNTMTWDMQALAVRPWYSKRTLVETFTAQAANFRVGHQYDEKTIAIANRGNMPQWLVFQITLPPGAKKGRAWVQDGMLAGTLKAIPSEDGWITADESPVLVDCDEAAMTVTAANDPIDNEFYKLLRANKIIEFVMQDLIGDPLGEPIWERASGLRFTSMIPPRTVANVRVRHDTPGGTVSVMCRQWFTRPF